MMFVGRRCRCSINQKPRYVSVPSLTEKHRDLAVFWHTAQFGYPDNLWLLSLGPLVMRRLRRKTWLSRRVRCKFELSVSSYHLWLTSWHTSIIKFPFESVHSTEEDEGVHMLNCSVRVRACTERDHTSCVWTTVSYWCNFIPFKLLKL